MLATGENSRGYAVLNFGSADSRDRPYSTSRAQDRQQIERLPTNAAALLKWHAAAIPALVLIGGLVAGWRLGTAISYGASGAFFAIETPRRGRAADPDINWSFVGARAAHT